MNAAHIHLLVNHLPIFATLLALPIALAAAFAAATPQLLRVLAFLLVTAAVGTGIATRSGEDAEEIIEPMEHVETTQIHQHSDAAHEAGPIVLCVGFTSLVALVLDSRHRGRTRRRIAIAMLVATCISARFLIRAGVSGGKIQHRELREGFDPNAPVTTEDPIDL